MSAATTGRPLSGQRVLVLRAAAQAPALSSRVREQGGEPIEAPVLRIEPGDREALREAARELAEGGFSLVCLTSPNGVAALAEAFQGVGLARSFAPGTFIGCVGPGTAAALREQLGVDADLVPDVATTEALGHALPSGHGRALLPRADLANPVLGRLVSEQGYEPVEVVAYRTRPVDRLPDEVVAELEAGGVDLVAFGSPSTVRAFAALVGSRPWQARAVSIGPVTSAACREAGIEVAAEAFPHDLDGLVAAMVRVASPERA